MERKEADKQDISIYWWNLGTKTLDFGGEAKDYLKDKNIRITRRKRKQGYHCIIPVGTHLITLLTSDYDYAETMNKAIILFLTMLGDKTVYRGLYGKEYKINWR
jgi:hypothetical protein